MARIRDLPAITSPVAFQEFARPMNCLASMIARCFGSRVEKHLKQRFITARGRSDLTVQM